MYLPPRPLASDDRYFAVRLAFMPVLGFILGTIFQTPLMMIFPAVMYSLTAGNRKAFNPKRAFGAPVAFSLALWAMSGIVALLSDNPVSLVIAFGLVYFLAFYIIQTTANGIGLLLIVAAALMSVMGMGSYEMMTWMRSELTKTALCCAVFVPLLYALIPTQTKERHEDILPVLDLNGSLERALVRAVVMTGFCIFLYTIIDFGNVVMAVGAMFVLVFTTEGRVIQEAGQRVFSAILGGIFAMLLLSVMHLTGSPLVFLICVYAGAFWCGHKMIHGKLHFMAYQDVGSVMLSITGSALTTSDPAFAFAQRAGMTAVGTIIAASIIILADHVIARRYAQRPRKVDA